MENYTVVSTISVALVFIRMLQYFTFSQKLSAFSEIISAASFDIIFFGLMWALMLFGFSMAFFAVYGRSMSHFAKVSSSYLESFNMSYNEFRFDTMTEVDYTFTVPVFIVFMVIFRLLLFNMFIAIISAHYFQFQREAAEDESGD